MQKETYELFERKFLSKCFPEEKQFLKEIAEYRERHKKDADDNRDKYFDNNLLLISLLSGNKILKITVTFLATVVSAIGITRIIEVCLSISNIVVSKKLNLIMVVCIGFSILFIGIWSIFLLEKKRRELELRKYGETWVRHRMAISAYDAEILKYTYNLEHYKGKKDREQRELFMEKILGIESQDMDKFEKNMSRIQ